MGAALITDPHPRRPALGAFAPSILAGLLFVACSEPVTDAPPLEVMSFNIRYDNPADAPHHWAARREAAYAVVRAADPDVLALQEVLTTQLEDWRAALPDYTAVAFGREGPDDGERVVLFLRTARARVEASGGFWLSPTPDLPSQGWDASLPRVAVWARVSGPDGPLTVVGTHLDHLGPESRRRSAAQIKAWLAAAGASSALVLGDFNADPAGPAHGILVGPEPPRLRDTYRALHDAEPGGTFHNWGEMFVDARIDWIFATEDWRVTAAGVDRSRPEGVWPSDHYPVTATLERGR